MCNNLAEADELIDLARASGIVGMVAYHKRYDPAIVSGRPPSARSNDRT